MSGTKTNILNEAIRNIIPQLQQIAADNLDAEIKIAVLKYADNAEWLTPSPVDINYFKWKFVDCEGESNFGNACYHLRKAFSDKNFITLPAYYPVVFLFTDSGSKSAYYEELDRLYENDLFEQSIRIGIAIGQNANNDLLLDFTGTKEKATSENLLKNHEKYDIME
jgi:uncharacterized protein YegL